jgi:hypothetical protein
MAVSILINDQKKVVADVIPVALITEIGDETKIYSGAEWLLCDDSAVSRTEYAGLFAAIGTTFGPGDGTTTFNLPNANPTIVSGEKTFSQFITETVITVDNTAPIGIDISAGAVQAGIRVSIIETSAQTVTVYTDAAHEQSCVLPKGMIVLEWDGGQWCLISETVRILVTITEDGTWKTPFGAVYTLRAIGGGGGGAQANNGTASAGGGAGGSCHQVSKYEAAGTTLTANIGSGGAGDQGYGDGDAGGNTTLSDGAITLYGMGGNGGEGVNVSGASSSGGGGSAKKRPTEKYPMNLYTSGLNGGSGTSSKSGAGGDSGNSNGFGGAGVNLNNNGNDGGAYGGGGSGGAVTGTGSKDGGDGADGVAYIEY